MSKHENENHIPEGEIRDVTALETSRVKGPNSDAHQNESDISEAHFDSAMSLFQTELAELGDNGSRISDDSVEEERKSDMNVLIRAGIVHQLKKRDRREIESHEESDSDGEDNDWRSKAV